MRDEETERKLTAALLENVAAHIRNGGYYEQPITFMFEHQPDEVAWVEFDVRAEMSPGIMQSIDTLLGDGEE